MADILSRLSRDRLKDVCRALNLEEAGREKNVLVERIVSGGRPAPADSPDQEDGGDDAGTLVLTNPAPKSPKNGNGAKGVKATAPKGPKGVNDLAQVLSYRHADRRKNNPEVGMVDPDTDPAQPKTKWAYDPHLDPALQFDVGRAQVEKLIDDALASGDQTVMGAALEQLKRQAAPYLNWAGKAERTSFDIDTVSLHVHERIDPASILTAVRTRMRGEKPAQPKMQLGLFSAPGSAPR